MMAAGSPGCGFGPGLLQPPVEGRLLPLGPPAWPPLLIVQGTNDDNLTPDMADRFADADRSAGGEVTLRKFEGGSIPS